MKKTKILVIIALFTALICVLTIFPKVPVPSGGYIHLGDAMIIAAVFFIGIYAVPAAALGSALADLLGGYFIYTPATLIIKGLMALAAFVILSKRDNVSGFVFASVVSEIIMFVLYFLFDTVLYNFEGAVATIPFSLAQATSGIILGVVLCMIIKKSKLKEKFYFNL